MLEVNTADAFVLREEGEAIKSLHAVKSLGTISVCTDLYNVLVFLLSGVTERKEFLKEDINSVVFKVLLVCIK